MPYLVGDPLDQCMRLFVVRSGLHLIPFLVDHEPDIARDLRADKVILRKQIALSVDDGQRTGFLVRALLGRLEVLPYADRKEREQDGIHHADDCEYKTGNLVMLGQQRLRNVPMEEQTARRRQYDKGADE